MNIKKKKQNNYTGKFILAFLVLGLLASACFYMFQVNSIASGGFKISEIDKKIIKTEKDIEGLKLESSKLQSITILKAASEKFGMARTAHPEFLRLEGGVALNK
ncbi:MAG: hypothetical protein V1698_00680 [bacterium]